MWDAQPSQPSQVRYGGFWIRLVAYIIDAILLSFVGVAIGYATGMNMFSSDYKDFNPGPQLLSLAIGWLYFALLESSERGATVGKMAVGPSTVLRC